MSTTITPEEWAARLHEAAGDKLRKELRRFMVGVALEAEGEAKDNATRSPQVRSGTLRRSIAGTVEARGDVLALTLSAGGRTGGQDLAYAALQEFGGIVRPKAAKWLAIPVGAAKTRAGVSRGGPRMFGDLRFQPSANAPQQKAYLVRDAGRGRSARSELLFVLVRRTEHRPHRYLGRAWDRVPPQVLEAMSGALREVLP